MDQDPNTTGDNGTQKLDTVQTEVAEVNPKPQKKSHVGVIVAGIISAVIVVLLGALVAWYFIFYNQPEKAAFDAMDQLFRSNTVAVNGDFVVWSDSADGPINRLILSLDSASQSLPNSITVELRVEFTDGNEIKLGLGGVQSADGVIYLQISGIVDSLEQLEVDEFTEAGIVEIINSLDVIDNEWWEISIPDILDSLELDPDQTKGLKEVYVCVIDTMKDGQSDDLAKLYGQYQFVSATTVEYTLPRDSERTHYPAAWHHLYEITINKSKLAHFINGIPETSTATEFYNCFNSVMAKYSDGGYYESLSSADFEEVSASDLDFIDEARLYIEVADFSHRLIGVYVYLNDSGVQLSGALELNYQPVVVSTPDDYRPITELIDGIIELLAGGLTE